MCFCQINSLEFWSHPGTVECLGSPECDNFTTVNETVTYELLKSDVQCQYWDEDLQAWTPSNCQVTSTNFVIVSPCQYWTNERKSEYIVPCSTYCCQVENASPKSVRFKSNLFGSFGAGLFTGPNTIDFGAGV